jgi:hypothetical protein
MTHGTLTLERAYQLHTEAIAARDAALRRGNEAWVRAWAKKVKWLGEWISRREGEKAKEEGAACPAQ